MVIPRDHRLDGAGDRQLLDFVAASARRASDGGLALTAGVGLAGVGVMLMGGYPWVILLPAFLSLALFGLWGILDRTIAEMTGEELRSDGVDRRVVVLSAVRAGVVVVGTVSAVAAVVVPLATTLTNVLH